jgi:hypothetical protein
MQKVTITINNDGTITSHVEGIKGKTCKNIGKVLQDVLKGEVINQKDTVEMHMVEVKNTVQKKLSC